MYVYVYVYVYVQMKKNSVSTEANDTRVYLEIPTLQPDNLTDKRVGHRPSLMYSRGGS